MIYFYNRSWENLREIKPDNFEVHTDEDGLRYVVKRDQLTKNNCEDVYEISNSGVMYEIPGSAKCPVETFTKYVSKLNKKCPFLWQKPKPPTKSWMMTAPASPGIAMLHLAKIRWETWWRKLLRRQVVLSSTPIIACSTALESAGFESRDILSVNGHQSEQSRKNYSKKSHERKRQMAASLGSHLGERGEASGPGPALAPSKPSTSSTSRSTLQVYWKECSSKHTFSAYFR